MHVCSKAIMIGEIYICQINNNILEKVIDNTISNPYDIMAKCVKLVTYNWHDSATFACYIFLEYNAILQVMKANTIDIRLTVCPLNCTILLSALFFYRGQNPNKKNYIVS